MTSQNPSLLRSCVFGHHATLPLKRVEECCMTSKKKNRQWRRLTESPPPENSNPCLRLYGHFLELHIYTNLLFYFFFKLEEVVGIKKHYCFLQFFGGALLAYFVGFTWIIYPVLLVSSMENIVLILKLFSLNCQVVIPYYPISCNILHPVHSNCK